MKQFILIPICAIAVLASHGLAAQTKKADSLIALAARMPDDTAKLELLARISWAFLAPRIELDRGRAYADTLLQLATRLQNDKWKMRSNFYYGAYERFQGNHEDAVEYLQPYVKYFEMQGDSNWVADGLFQLATLYHRLGDYAKSVATLYRIIAIDKMLNKPINVAYSLNSIGSDFFNAQKYPEAINAYTEALSIFDSLSAEDRESLTLLNLGNVYVKTREFDKAKVYYREALRLDRKYDVVYGVAYDLANIAFLFDGMHQYDSGLFYHLQALAIRRDLADKDDLTRSLIGVAHGYMFTGDFRRSEAFFNDALKVSKQINSKPLLENVYSGLADLYSRQKNFEKAFSFLNLQSQIHDSVLNEESSRQINELNARYQTEKKSRRITLLEKEKILRAQQAESEALQKKIWTGASILIFIAASALAYSYRQRLKNQKHIAVKNDQLKEANFRQQVTELELKALKAQINPHFFFNCMNSINRMILEGDGDNASRYLTKFSKLVRSVLENSDSDHISLALELDILGTYIQLEELRLKEKIRYSVVVDETINPDETFLPPMILQPFVENAIWHGLMPGDHANAQITIVITKVGQTLHCVIEDNGIGREKAKQMQTNAVWKTKSMGMKITEERLRLLTTEKLRKLIHVTDLREKDVATGTRVDIHVPVV